MTARGERFWMAKKKKQERVLTARGIRGSERECVCGTEERKTSKGRAAKKKRGGLQVREK